MLHSAVARVLNFIFDSGSEKVLNVFMARFPELRRDIDKMEFPPGSAAENLRRRALYRYWFEPDAAGSDGVG